MELWKKSFHIDLKPNYGETSCGI